ncbi:protein terminal ear1 isoform X2 [Jatropha curcas]|uniref:protein terminal ear1 isoform X2 n=1 Tax=Jatropha curcas TaxID=180498 RepID=UPI0009D63D3A|nr:protein terminal ear1 isoform X2 [Jatropha curcas]
MGETGIVRFPGSLDPRAQEFRPRNNPSNVNFTQQIPLFGPPPLPPPPPPHQLYYPYAPQAVPFSDGGVVGYPQYHTSPPAYVSTAPPLPPQSAAPTRTLVLNLVPTDVSESMIRRELEVFGEVRGVQMERICDGIVTVHFYDLRHAEQALKEVREQHMHQQTRIRNLFATLEQSPGFLGPGENLLAPPPPAARGLIAGCAVWAQFIIPPCNTVPDGHNQGTIVVFNLDPNVSTSSLEEIFQAFGSVKELRETPLKKQQRFVEFYDIRDAAKALREMNGKEIYGKQVVIEFSRPGGYSRRFFNASKTTSINNTIANAKFSRYAPPQPPLSPPPPPPPPLPRRFSSRSPSNIPPRAFLAQTQSSSAKKISNFSKGNPNENINDKSSIEDSMVCLSISGGDGDGVADKVSDGSSKRNAKKSLNKETCAASTKQQHKSRPWKSRQTKKFDTRFLINEDAMVESNCSDSRTTVMIKNIPNKYSNKCNVGYGFVNMTSPQATRRLYKAFHHQHWEVFNSRKICEVTYARVQGLEALKEHFKNSKFPCEMDHYLPVVFSPPRDGRQLSDPQPIVGQKQNLPVILGFPMDPTDLKDKDTDQEEGEDEEDLNRSSSYS